MFFKLFIEKQVVYAAAIITASLIVAGLAITGLVLMSMALTDGLTLLTGHRWVGELGTGVALFAIAAIAALVIFRVREENADPSSKSADGSHFGAEILRLAKSHPEVTIGVAAVVGFVLAHLISRPRRTERPSTSPAESGKPRHTGSYLAFLTEVLGLARPFITQFLSNYWDPKSPSSSHDGHGAQPSAQAESAPASHPREL